MIRVRFVKKLTVEQIQEALCALQFIRVYSATNMPTVNVEKFEGCVMKRLGRYMKYTGQPAGY